MDNVDNLVDGFVNSALRVKIIVDKNVQKIIKNPQQKKSKEIFAVDNVDKNYFNIFSPTFTISPAPIVINKSPDLQVWIRKFSTSSKVLKKYASCPFSDIIFLMLSEEISPGFSSLAA